MSILRFYSSDPCQRVSIPRMRGMRVASLYGLHVRAPDNLSSIIVSPPTMTRYSSRQTLFLNSGH